MKTSKWNSKRKSGSSGVFAAVCAVICLGVVMGGCGNDSGSNLSTTPNVTAEVSGSTTPTLASGLTINLTGGATIEDGSIASYAWTTQSVPLGVTPTFGDSTQANTTVTNLTKAGEYVFKLTATSAAGVVGTKTVTVNVQAYQAVKDVVVSFPSFVADPTLSFEPEAYTPVIAGGGFKNSDVTYIVTDDQGNTWDSMTGYTVDVTPYAKPSDVVFTQTYKMNDTVLVSQVIKATATAVAGGRFSVILDDNNNPLPKITSINLHLEKTVTEVE